MENKGLKFKFAISKGQPFDEKKVILRKTIAAVDTLDAYLQMESYVRSNGLIKDKKGVTIHCYN